jgi:hypothetical protein
MEPRLDAEIQALENVDATKAPLASPALTGTPTAPTAAAGTNTTQIATTAYVIGQAANATSPMNGTAAIGTSTRYARQDHVHPTDTTRAPLASPALTGTPTSTTAAADTNTTQIATTAFVAGQAGSANPLINGTAAPGTSLRYSRQDHVHPVDTSRAPAAGSSSITTVGTVTSGTWSATDVGLAHGGTNASLTAVNGGVVYSGASAMAITGAGTTGQVLRSNGAAAPTWQTNNLDSLSDVVISSPSAGQTLAYNGTNWINGSGGGGGVTASATAPTSPVNGSAWFDTNDGTLYIYYTDVNGSQWVEVQADSALGSQLATRMSTAETNITGLRQVSPNFVNSQAARDALYPSPVQGNKVFRNDKGYEEQYFALYNASTNVGGATPAGWYPVAGTLPVYQVVKNATNFTPTSGAWFALSNTAHWTAVEADPTGVITYNGNFTVGLTGWYEIFGAVWTDGGTGGPGIMQAKKNNTTPGVGDMLAVQSWAGGFNWTTGHLSRAVKLNAGDYVHWQYITNNPVAVGTNNREATYLGVRWLRPAKG